MLTPEEKAKAIRIMTNAYQSKMQYNGNSALTDMLMFGHRGFASWSDGELLRAIQACGKNNNNYECQQFISGIALDKFILE